MKEKKSSFLLTSICICVCIGCGDNNDEYQGIDTESVLDSDTNSDGGTDYQTDTGTDYQTDTGLQTDTDSSGGTDTETSIDSETATEGDNGAWELDNGVLHVKFDQNAGGSIRYISESGKDYNVVNIADKGRYIQQSYYAGQDLNRTKSGQHPAWSPWPWNPIQAGDVYGNKSRILDRFNDSKTMYIKTMPLLWDMNGEYAECEFETWVTLIGTVIRVRNKITIDRKDSLWTEVIPKHQELPAVYSIADLNNLYTYKGDAPWTNGDLTRIQNSGPPWEYWETSENWAAFVNNSNWGLGVFNKTCALFVGGFHGSPGGGPTNNSTGYISPLETKALDKNSVYEYEYDLILGNLSDIRSHAYNMHGAS